MFTYILRRILISVPTLVIISMIVFGLQLLLPGDPALALAGEDRDPQVIAYMRELYHLNDPIYVQYGYWISGVLHGDLGQSIRLKLAVSELVKAKLPVTMQLASMAFTIALLIGIPTGIISAVRKGSAVDYIANVLGLAGLSVPTFWLGIIMILFFSVDLGWLPASGYVSPFEDLKQNLASMIMPAFVLGAAISAQLMRQTRSSMLTVLRSDFVRTARAKGLREPRVVYRHALRNALIPVVTVGAILLGQLLAGAVLTEQVFTIPGFGKLIVDAVFNRDYAVVQGVVLCSATGFLFLNLCADLIYFLVNPRMRG